MPAENDACLFCRFDPDSHVIVLGKAAGSRIAGKYHGFATKEELEGLLGTLERAAQSRGDTTLSNLTVKTGKSSGVKTDYVIGYEEAAAIVPILRAYLEAVEAGSETQFADVYQDDEDLGSPN